MLETKPDFVYPAVPNFVQVESSTACDAKCLFCARPKMQRRGGSMPDALFDSILGQVSELGHTHIGLFLNGEPMVFPRLFDWLDKLRKSRIKTHIFTNGHALDEEKAKRIVRYWDVIDTVVFSLGGKDEASYKEIMGLDYETVRQNVECFVGLNDGRLATYAHIPLFSRTAAFLDEWQRVWGRILTASATSMFNWAGLVRDEMELSEGGTLKRQPCRRLSHLTVLWDGRVALCCMDVEGRGFGGDLNTQTIRQVYSGPVLARYRSLHEQGRYTELELCAPCNMNIMEGRDPDGPAI